MRSPTLELTKPPLIPLIGKTKVYSFLVVANFSIEYVHLVPSLLRIEVQCEFNCSLWICCHLFEEVQAFRLWLWRFA